MILPALALLLASSTPIPVHVGGRIVSEADGSHRFGWPGVYFEGRFRGTGVEATVESGTEHLRLLVDGEERARLTRPGLATLRVEGLAPGEHVVRLEKLTESQTGGARFLGFRTLDGAALPPARRKMGIEFIGDSHSVGYGNRSPGRICSQAEVHDFTDSQAAFPALLASRLDADYRVIAYSGFGIVRNYDGGRPGESLPGLYPRAMPGEPAQAARDDWAPQLIVINLGTNDFSTPLKAGEPWGDQAALRDAWRRRYVAFARERMADQPQARLVLMGAPPFLDLVEEVAAELNRAAPGRVKTVPVSGLDLMGCHHHPSLADHRALADTLAQAISAPAPTGAAAPPAPPLRNIEERSLAELQAMLRRGETTALAITEAYLARIASMDAAGPALRSVIATNPQALDAARASDQRRWAGRTLGPLDGMPILIKDNIDTADPLPTTAGSLALKDNLTRRDAPVVARLRAAGAVVLGKTNLSEWANIRSTRSMSGWSATGGLVRNPYVLDRTACGSSSGSGAAIAASFAAAALGTETDGSVICPSSMNGLVGLKPTIGLVSRTHVVPISHSQDTAGPMARTVADAAILFSAMVGADPADPTTRGAAAHARDYAAALAGYSLKGRRIAVMRPEMTAALAERFDAALAVLKGQGAVLVDVKRPDTPGLGEAELQVLETELKADLDAYLATTPPQVTARTLNAVIAFNRANAAAEMPYFGQELFESAVKRPGLADAGYREARAKSFAAACGALDKMLADAGAELLVTPSYGPAWPSDPVHGDQYGGPSASGLPAISGYPHLTVPMGLVMELPVGLSFIGKPFSEANLFGAGHAYEQAAQARKPPRYLPTVPVAAPAGR